MSSPHDAPFQIVHSGQPDAGAHTPFSGGPSDWAPGSVESDDPHDVGYSTGPFDAAPVPGNIRGFTPDGEVDFGDGGDDPHDEPYDGDEDDPDESDCGPSVAARAYVVPGPFSKSKQG
jgi:hypothetical protein